VNSVKRKLLFWNLYPPFLGAGIKIEEVAEDYSSLTASLTPKWWNRNYVGTLFGGSIYSLCDPFHMVLLMHRLGNEFKVRDKGAEIRFLKKGIEKVWARFEISREVEDEILRSQEEVMERRFTVQVKNFHGDVVAEVVKILHIRNLRMGNHSNRASR
jgi:acyl-coenzyme A thioesterase PaaI-like protein